MKCSRAQTTPLILLVAALSIGLSGCSRQETVREQTPPTAAQSPVATQTETLTQTPLPANEEAKNREAPVPDLSPPRPDEIRLAVARVYETAVKLDEQSVGRAIVGDFNGDGSADIAVVVRPTAEQLAEVNSEVANWIVEDPHAVVVPDMTKTVHHLPASEERAVIGAGDTLLAIIHGHEQAGWRNPNAKQSYLLKNAVGSGMKPQSREEAASAIAKAKMHPRLRGDVIKETLGTETGMLYWTGGKYGWYH